MDSTSYERLLARAAAYCAGSEHCASEVRAKLSLWEASGVDAEKIIHYLEEQNYLDERRFATAFVRDKFRFNGWGRFKIAVMLRQKRVAEESIAEALDAIGEEEYLQKLVDLLIAKRKTLKALPAPELKMKLMRFAASRGFEGDAIHRALSMMA